MMARLMLHGFRDEKTEATQSLQSPYYLLQTQNEEIDLIFECPEADQFTQNMKIAPLFPLFWHQVAPHQGFKLTFFLQFSSSNQLSSKRFIESLV